MTSEQVEDLEESLANSEIDVSLLKQEVKMLTFQNFALLAEVKRLETEIDDMGSDLDWYRAGGVL